MQKSKKTRLIAIGALIVLAHAVVLFIVIPALSHRLAPAYNQDRFADGYDQLAANLVDGHGYRFYPDTARTMMREPGFPVLLAGIMLLFGQSLTAVKVMNLLLALATAYLMFRLMQLLRPPDGRWDPLLWFAPATLFLFNPGILIAESRGGVEIIFGFLLAAFFLAIARAVCSQRARDYAISGLVLGVTVLVRSTPMLFPLLLLPFLLVRERRSTPLLVTCRNVTLLVVCMLLMQSPWILRNYLLTGKFVPTASVVGVSAQAGEYINEHLFQGTPWWLLDRAASRERDQIAKKLGLPFADGSDGYYQTFYRSSDELVFSRYLSQMVMDRYKRSPLLAARCLGQNLFNFWFAGKTWKSTGLNVIAQLPYLILAAMGAAACFREKNSLVISLAVLFIAYYAGVHIPILAQARYSIPLMWLLSVLGAIGLDRIWKRVAVPARSERQPLAAPGMADRQIAFSARESL